MASTLDGFVKMVMAQTASGSWRDLADLHRKAVYDVLDRNVAHLDSVLETLTVDRYSMSVVSVLFVKMNQTKIDATKESYERALSQIESVVPFFDSTQIAYIPDIYVLLFRKVYEYCLQQINKPARGIMLLSNALNVLTKDQQDMLTSLHPCLFCLCLKARIHEPALPYLNLAVSKIFKETPSQTGSYMDPKWVLLYFYYGGLLFAVLGRYEEAFLMMQKVCCIPAVSASAIMVQAYKKYALLSLLLYGKIVQLTNYRSPVITRNVIPYCSEYTSLGKICSNGSENLDKATAILEYLEENRATFEKDKSVGLVKLLVKRIRENSVKKLAQCFMSLSLADIARRCYLDDCEHAERYLRDMSKDGEISVRIDKKSGIVYFDEIKAEADERKVDEAASLIYKYDALMKEFDDRIRANPTYISRIGRPPMVGRAGSGSSGGTVTVPPDEGLGYPGTAFMPNINVGGIESAAVRLMDMLD